MKKTPKKTPNRSEKIETRVTLDEKKQIDMQLGRAKSEVIRNFLLGFRVAHPNPPIRRKKANLLRLLILQRREVYKARKLLLNEVSLDTAMKGKLSRIVELEEQFFHATIKAILDL